MPCHICQSEAVTRCYTCGELLCEEHGKNENCPRCSTGFLAGSPRALAISEEPLSAEQHHGWWRPQQAEEYTPPACYECKGLARTVCRNCLSNYCRDHAGPHGLCRACGQSANLGLYVIGGVFAFLFLLCICHWLFNR
jgi:hypothetical protein